MDMTEVQRREGQSHPGGIEEMKGLCDAVGGAVWCEG